MSNLFGYVPVKTLRGYQEQGARAMALREEMALLDDVGLGKSCQALACAGILTKVGQIDCAVFLTKAGLITDPWEKEIKKHTKFVPYVVSGRSVANRKNWPLDRKVYLLNYELLSRSVCTAKERANNIGVNVEGVHIKGDAQNLLYLLQNKRCAVFADESHFFKTPDSNITRILLAMRKFMARRYILTATLVADRPEDVWSQVFFLDGGKLLGRSFPVFLTQYADRRQTKYGMVSVGYKNLHDLHAKIRSISLRRTAKDCPDIPPKVKRSRVVTCDGRHATVMRGLCRKAIDSLEGYSGRFIVVKAEEPLAKTLVDIQRASVCPWIIDPSCKTSAKITALLDMLEESTHSVLVWCVHRVVAEEIAKALTQAKVRAKFAHGGMSKAKREQVVEEFAQRKFRVLVCTLASMKEGKNKMVVAPQAAYLEHSYRLLDWVQSQGRIARIGQEADFVVIESFFMNLCMDRYIVDAVEKKEIDANCTIDGATISIKLDRIKLLAHLKRSA